MISLIGLQLLQERMMGYILYVYINSGYHIITILRIYLITILYRFPLTLSYLLFEVSPFYP